MSVPSPSGLDDGVARVVDHVGVVAGAALRAGRCPRRRRGCRLSSPPDQGIVAAAAGEAVVPGASEDRLALGPAGGGIVAVAEVDETRDAAAASVEDVVAAHEDDVAVEEAGVAQDLLPVAALDGGCPVHGAGIGEGGDLAVHGRQQGADAAGAAERLDQPAVDGVAVVAQPHPVGVARDGAEIRDAGVVGIGIGLEAHLARDGAGVRHAGALVVDEDAREPAVDRARHSPPCRSRR